MEREVVERNLQREGFKVKYFMTADEAVLYLKESIKDKTVGMGGSVTLEELGLYDELSAENTVYWHWRQPADAARRQAASAQIYICSANAVAQTGEIVNIDGSGNRIAASLYGHEKVYIIIGTNKIAPDYEQALWRARNIAAPMNAKRLKCKTPCVLSEKMRCYNCQSPDRICRSVNVLLQKTNGNQEMEIIIIDSKLGY